MLTLSGTPDFTQSWGVHDFTHSLYIHYILLNLSDLGICLRINDLFAWINLTALSRTYFIHNFTGTDFEYERDNKDKIDMET